MHADVDVWGLIDGIACRSACFETFAKYVESLRVGGMKQSEAQRICVYLRSSAVHFTFSDADSH